MTAPALEAARELMDAHVDHWHGDLEGAIAAALTAFGAQEFERGRAAGLEEAAKEAEDYERIADEDVAEASREQDFGSAAVALGAAGTAQTIASAIRALRSGAGETNK